MPTTGPLVIRRSRGNAAPATQVTRVRRTRQNEEIEVTVTIRTTVVERQGQVTQDHLFVWAQEAIAKYHNFRGGFITVQDGRLGGIKPPTVTDP